MSYRLEKVLIHLVIIAIKYEADCKPQAMPENSSALLTRPSKSYVIISVCIKFGNST